MIKITKITGGETSYVKDNLIEGEKIIYEVKINWTAWVPSFIGLLFMDIVSLIFVIEGIRMSFIALPIFIFGTYAVYMIPYTTELVLTNKRVISKTGLIKRKTSELKISKLETVEIDQSVLERIFNEGTVICVGTGGSKTKLSGVDNPLEFRKKFLEYADKNSQ